jgi:hypothetical protein
VARAVELVAALMLAGCGGGDGGGGGGGSSPLAPERVRDFTGEHVARCPDPQLEQKDEDGFDATVVTCDGRAFVTVGEFADEDAVRSYHSDNTSYNRLVDGNVAVWTSNRYFDAEEEGDQGLDFIEGLKAHCGCGEIYIAES